MTKIGIPLNNFTLASASTKPASSSSLEGLSANDQASFKYFAKQLSPSPKATTLMTMYLAARRLENSALDIGVKNGSRILAENIDSVLMDKDGQPKQRINPSSEKIQEKAKTLFEMSLRALDSQRGFIHDTNKTQGLLLLNLGKLIADPSLKPALNGSEQLVDAVRDNSKTLAESLSSVDANLAGQLVFLNKFDFGIEKPKTVIKEKPVISDIHPDLSSDDPIKLLEAKFGELYKSVQALKTEDRLFNQDLLMAIAKIQKEKSRLLEAVNSGLEVGAKDEINNEFSLGIRLLELVLGKSKDTELVTKLKRNQLNEMKFLADLIANGDEARTKRFITAHFVEKQKARLKIISIDTQEPRILTPVKKLEAELDKVSKSLYDSKEAPSDAEKRNLTLLFREVDKVMDSYNQFTTMFPVVKEEK